MLINLISTEKVEDGKYKLIAKEGEFYSKENGYNAGAYDIEVKPMLYKGQQIKAVTSIVSIEEEVKVASKKAVVSSTLSNDGDKMSKADWAKKDRGIVKQTVIKAVLGCPGLAMVAAQKSEDQISAPYIKLFKDMMAAFDATN